MSKLAHSHQPTMDAMDRAAAEKAFGTIDARLEPLPIFTNAFDWCATFDDYEPGDPVGRGVTKADAVIDLLEQMEEKPE